MWRVGLAACALIACGRLGFESRPDDAGTCLDCSWHVDDYGACSESCTTGLQSRVVDCRDGSGAVVGESACTAARPSETQPCSETGCAWLTGDWSACDVNCGGGAQLRTVECRSGSGRLNPDAYCDGGTIPAAAMTCNSQACCMDLGNTVHELPRGGSLCGTIARYMLNPDPASMMQRCTELGYDRYGDFNVPFMPTEWCNFCNARTKYWDGTAWIENGCNVGINTLRCCDLP